MIQRSLEESRNSWEKFTRRPAQSGPSSTKIVAKTIWPILVCFRTNFPSSTKLVEVGRNRSLFAESLPKSAESGPKLAEEKNSGQVFAKFGQGCRRFGRPGPKVARSDKVSRPLVEICRNRPHFDRLRPDCGRMRARLGRPTHEHIPLLPDSSRPRWLTTPCMPTHSADFENVANLEDVPGSRRARAATPTLPPALSGKPWIYTKIGPAGTVRQGGPRYATPASPRPRIFVMHVVWGHRQMLPLRVSPNKNEAFIQFMTIHNSKKAVQKCSTYSRSSNTC